jgi:hypothetical protein
VSIVAACSGNGGTQQPANTGGDPAGMSGDGLGPGTPGNQAGQGSASTAGAGTSVTGASASGSGSNLPLAGATAGTAGDGASGRSPGAGSGGTSAADQCPQDPNKTASGICGCGTPDSDSDNDGTPDCKQAVPVIGECKVGPIPDAIRSSYSIGPFYQKYADANGIPVATSSKVSDKAISLACQLVIEMVSRSDDARKALIAGKMRFTLIAASEQLSDIPEVGAMYGTSLNARARGLGSIIPTICAEENVLCQLPDPWAGENICVHEYSHTMADLGFSRVDPTFKTRLDAAFRAAQASGKFANTYAISKQAEFWAEGVQDWYNSNLQSRSGTADGSHNSINTREELKAASPELYDLIASVFPANIQFADCYAK